MKNVLITGGTSGIGYSLAKEFAVQGDSLLLVSSKEENLVHAKEELERLFGVEILTFQQDLSQLGAAEELFEKVQKTGKKIDILINNAGFGLVDTTEKIDYLEDEKMMILNMISLVQLCKLFLPLMYQNKSGKILNVASTGAFQPGPYTSTYFASKSFVLSYSKAIRMEAEKNDVQVCTLCPGATRTNFFPRENTEAPTDAMNPDNVAKIAIRQLAKNQAVVVPGIKNRLMQLVPEKIRSLVVAKMKLTEIRNRID